MESNELRLLEDLRSKISDLRIEANKWYQHNSQISFAYRKAIRDTLWCIDREIESRTTAMPAEKR